MERTSRGRSTRGHDATARAPASPGRRPPAPRPASVSAARRPAGPAHGNRRPGVGSRRPLARDPGGCACRSRASFVRQQASWAAATGTSCRRGLFFDGRCHPRRGSTTATRRVPLAPASPDPRSSGRWVPSSPVRIAPRTTGPRARPVAPNPAFRSRPIREPVVDTAPPAAPLGHGAYRRPLAACEHLPTVPSAYPEAPAAGRWMSSQALGPIGSRHNGARRCIRVPRIMGLTRIARYRRDRPRRCVARRDRRLGQGRGLRGGSKRGWDGDGAQARARAGIRASGWSAGTWPG